MDQILQGIQTTVNHHYSGLPFFRQKVRNINWSVRSRQPTAFQPYLNHHIIQDLKAAGRHHCYHNIWSNGEAVGIDVQIGQGLQIDGAIGTQGPGAAYAVDMGLPIGGIWLELNLASS